jgi:hypothetical protein
MTKQKLPKGAPKKKAKTPAPQPAVETEEEDTKLAPPVELPQVDGDEAFEEDFTDVEDGFPMADEGMHHAKVIDFEKGESQAGNPQYVWQFRITAGDSKDVELRFWTSLLPQARWKTVESLTAVGIEAKGSVAKFSKSDILGKPCLIEVFHDVYDGNTTHKVKKVYPPNEETIKFAKADKTPF